MVIGIGCGETRKRTESIRGSQNRQKLIMGLVALQLVSTITPSSA